MYHAAPSVATSRRELTVDRRQGENEALYIACQAIRGCVQGMCSIELLFFLRHFTAECLTLQCSHVQESTFRQ